MIDRIIPIPVRLSSAPAAATDPSRLPAGGSLRRDVGAGMLGGRASISITHPLALAPAPTVRSADTRRHGLPTAGCGTFGLGSTPAARLPRRSLVARRLPAVHVHGSDARNGAGEGEQRAGGAGVVRL